MSKKIKDPSTNERRIKSYGKKVKKMGRTKIQVIKREKRIEKKRKKRTKICKKDSEKKR